MMRPGTRCLLVGAGLVAAWYAARLRPRILAWGSTPAERAESLPGDRLTAEATYVTTRAITIGAPAAAVWPWLVQMGQDRAGFYTHNWVERLLQSGIPDTDAIRTPWQTLQPGDLMRTNRDIGGKPVGWLVDSVDPGRSLVVRSKRMPAGTYAFVVRAVDDTTTRLIVRDRAAWKWWEWPFALLVYEPLHGYMETGVLQGIRRRAEQWAPDQRSVAGRPTKSGQTTRASGLSSVAD